MEEESQIESWIFDYLVHRCIKRYFEAGGLRPNDDNDSLDFEAMNPFMNSESLDLKDPRKALFGVFCQLLSMEFALEVGEDETDCIYLGEDDFVSSITYCIAFSAQGTHDEKTRTLAQQCLIQSHVVHIKYCLKKQISQEETLELFRNFTKILPTKECQEMYVTCANMKEISTLDDFISDYISLIKQLVKALFTELEVPELIKFYDSRNLDVAMDSSHSESKRRSPEDVSDSKASAEKKDDDSDVVMNGELEILLRDKRPSKKSDLKEIRMEDNNNVSAIRKKVYGFQFNKESHLGKLVKLEKRISKRPPSHQVYRVGPWMPEEERAFIRKTLEIGAGQWKKIKEALNTSRSSQQLKDKWRQFKPHHIKEVERMMNPS